MILRFFTLFSPFYLHPLPFPPFLLLQLPLRLVLDLVLVCVPPTSVSSVATR